jgi:hypothetical protein
MNHQYKGHALGALTSADGETFDIDNLDKIVEILMEIHCEDDPSYGEKAMTTAQRNAKCRLKKQVQDYMVDKSNRIFISLMVRAMSQLEEPTRIMAKNRKLTAELRTLKKEFDEEAYVCSKVEREEIRKQEREKLENELKKMKDEVERRRDRARKHQAQLIQYSENEQAIRECKVMSKEDWSDFTTERAALELKIVELKKSNKEYKDNVGTDPVLKRKYKKLKKLKKKLEKEILDLKSKLDSESDDAEGDDEVSSSSETE